MNKDGKLPSSRNISLGVETSVSNVVHPITAPAASKIADAWAAVWMDEGARLGRVGVGLSGRGKAVR